MSCSDDIKLAFKFIAETQQRIADGRAEITRIMDEIESCVGKIEVVITSIQQNCQKPNLAGMDPNIHA